MSKTYIQFACFAASLRPGGICYAGKNIATGRWARPLMSVADHAIPHFEKVFSKGDPASIGDVILSANLGTHPIDWQTENYIKGPERWTRAGRITFADASKMVDTPTTIWGMGDHSSNGINDRVSIGNALSYDHSLALIAVNNVTVIAEMVEGGKIKMRAAFSYGGADYLLSLTEPYFNMPEEGQRDIGKALVCCSLPERWAMKDGTESPFVYKVVAGILTPERLG